MGRARLSDAAVALVKRLAAANGRWSYRRIAEETEKLGQRVAAASVERIIRGTHLAPRESTSRLAPGEEIVESFRCPVCGATIRVRPCRVCAARAERRQASAGLDPRTDPRRPPPPPEPRDRPGLELREDEAQRLADVRERRRTAGF